jgi:hypothetical protein
MAVFDVFAWSPIFLSDRATINIHVVSVVDVVELTDTVITNQHIQSVIDRLYLSDEVAVNQSLNLPVADTLVMAQDGQRTPIYVSAADHLIMWQKAQTYPQWPDVEQILPLSDVAVCYTAKAAFDTLVLSQSVIVTKSISVAAESILVMLSSGTVFKPDQFWTSFDVVVVNP